MPDHSIKESLVKIPYPELVNLYGCVIRSDAFIGPFVEIQSDVFIGTRTRISSHSFVCSGVIIGDDCFIGHGVMFVNDLFSDSDSMNSWIKRNTVVGNRVRIGSNATILPVNIGDDVIIGAGSVVTTDIPSGATVKGNPAK
jgi:acetyltransferase-like isoleucine patch superfamily enzyme